MLSGAASLLAVAAAAPACAQSNTPSAITPQTLRPAPEADPVPEALPEAQRLDPPAGSDNLSVRIGTIQVEGAFPAMVGETRRIVAAHENRTLTLAEIYTVAGAVEAAYIRRGYVLARIVVPPQELRDGGDVRLILVDGFIEDIQVSSLPSRVRGAVAARVAGLTGRRHLSLAEIEQPLVLAGSVPGVRLTSTLARGAQQGGTQLLLGGRQALVSGSLSIDNNYSAALGRYGVTAQIALNSPLGLGEQFYGVLVSGYDLSRAFRSDAPLRVLGGGAVFTSGDGRFSINPEVTFSRTQPFAQPGVPLTRGALRRYSLRGSFVARRTRTQSLSLGATIEQIRESSDAIGFGVRLSDDHFRVARLQASYSSASRRGGGLAGSVQISQGLGGVGQVPAGALPSRQGATDTFTKVTASLSAAEPIGRGFTVNVFAKGQNGFGRPLLRSEQAVLEGSDALSAYTGGETAVDDAITARLELTRSFTVRLLHLTPYAFAAAGKGWVQRPTAVETAELELVNLGAGIRAVLPRGIGVSAEYAHGFSKTPRYDKVDRIAASLSIGF